MKNISLVIGLIFMLLFSSCEKETTSSYSFFVAGHVYGQPGTTDLGLHPPFQEKFEFIRNYPSMSFGVFTGDIVQNSSPESWDEVDSNIIEIGHPVYFAPGNHDLTNPSLYKSRYGETWYSFTPEPQKSFKGKKDLHIVLDPNIDGWNISGDQLEFLKKQLKDAVNYNSVFIYFHQILWWTPENDFKAFRPNSTQGRAAETNFWTEVEPLFHTISNPIYCFAGDAGNYVNDNEIMYHQYKNIHFIASGMGRWTRDNFIIVDVKNGKVKFTLIAINGEATNALGKLEDYRL